MPPKRKEVKQDIVADKGLIGFDVNKPEPKVKIEEKKESVYTTLNKWLYDKSKFTTIPQEVLDGKEIGPQYLLYFFQSSPSILYLSDVFNNFNLYQMDLEDVLKMMKDIVLRTSFRPRFIPMSKDKVLNIVKKLKKQYPYLKNYELGILVNKIETLPQRDDIYESLGLIDTKKKKASKEIKEALKQNVPAQEALTIDKLMEDF